MELSEGAGEGGKETGRAKQRDRQRQNRRGRQGKQEREVGGEERRSKTRVKRGGTGEAHVGLGGDAEGERLHGHERLVEGHRGLVDDLHLLHAVQVELLAPRRHHARLVERAGLHRRRVGAVRDLAGVPVLQHSARRRLRVEHAALLDLAARLRDELQEVGDGSVAGDLVDGHEAHLVAAPEDLFDGRDRVDDGVDAHAVTEHRRGVGLVLGKHDTRTVEQPHLLVELHLLRDLGHPRMRSGLDRARADERVDEAALPHVGVADHADRHRHLDLAVARVVLQELQQLLASDALAAPSQLVLGRCGSSSLGAANVELLALGRALDGNGGQLSSEVLEPGRDVLLRDQIDLVQDQHDALARVLLLN
eukprot:3183708-Rhodomonas_salina.1